MSEETTRYRKKPVIEAVQFDGSNRRQVLKFAYPDMNEDGLRGAEVMALPVVIAWAGGDVALQPGDWAIREHGAIGVMDARTFAATYEPAPAVPPVEVDMHRWYAVIRQGGEVVAVIGHSDSGVGQYESVEAWERANS